MLFHTIRPRSKGMTASGDYVPGPHYQFDLIRVGAAGVFLVLLGVAAFIAKAINWNEGAVAFLHLLEVAAGGTAGLLFGERTALKGNVE
jgi:hypothetical protein